MAAAETLVRQLADVQDQLIALPDDAFMERFELLRTQTELRDRAAQHAAGADHERLTEDLLAELTTLSIQSGAGDDDVAAMTRIGRIQEILIARGVDLD